MALSAAAFVAAALSAENALLWLMAAAAILLAGAAIAEEATVVPSLFLFVVVYWLTVVCDLILADIDGVGMASLGGGPARVTAIEISFLVLVLMTVAMKRGFYLPAVRAARQKHRAQAFEPRLASTFRFYIFATGFALAAGVAARFVPPLAQPLAAFASLKLVALFLLVMCLKRQPSGVSMMALLMLFEGVMGTTSYIASFQPAFLTIIAAAMTGSTALRLKGTDFLALAVGGLIMVYVAVVWTAVKPEFRALIATADLSTSERVAWISNQVTDGLIDYGDATKKLIARVGYTQYYGLALARQQDGLTPETTLWLNGVKNVVMPRVLFANKAALNDTFITTMLTGVQFDDVTSVSIGYVAEAQMDFGFPFMLLPLGLLGYAIGFACHYIMTRRGAEMLNQSFVAALTCGAFQYQHNFEKTFGGFTLTALALFVLYNFKSTIVRMCSR